MRRGPNIDPWGTPEVALMKPELHSRVQLVVFYRLNNLQNKLIIPGLRNLASLIYVKVEYEVESNVVDKSKNNISVCIELSTILLTMAQTSTSWVACPWFTTYKAVLQWSNTILNRFIDILINTSFHNFRCYRQQRHQSIVRYFRSITIN